MASTKVEAGVTVLVAVADFEPVLYKGVRYVDFGDFGVTLSNNVGEFIAFYPHGEFLNVAVVEAATVG